MRHAVRRKAGRAFLWLAVVLGGIGSAFAAVAGFWMLYAPFFETHRTLVPIALAAIPVLGGSAWAATGVITLAEILRETRGQRPVQERSTHESRT